MILYSYREKTIPTDFKRVEVILQFFLGIALYYNCSYLSEKNKNKTYIMYTANMQWYNNDCSYHFDFLVLADYTSSDVKFFTIVRGMSNDRIIHKTWIFFGPGLMCFLYEN